MNAMDVVFTEKQIQNLFFFLADTFVHQIEHAKRTIVRTSNDTKKELVLLSAAAESVHYPIEHIYHQ